MRRIQILPTVALAAALVLAAASPADALVYFLGKIGATDAGDSVSDSFRSVLDGDDDSWGAGVGIHLSQYFAAQLEYLDLGSIAGTGSPCPPNVENCLAFEVPVTADTEAIAISALPTYPLTERLATYLKLGYLTFDTELSSALEGVEAFVEDFDDDEFLVGIGLRLTLPGPIGGFLEYERLGDVFDTVSIGVTFGY